MSTAPDEKKEAVEVEGELSWSGVKIPDHFHLSWFASVMGWGQRGNQPVRQAGLEVLFTILAASTQHESWGGVALAINGYPGVKQDYGTKAQDRMHDIATVVWVWAFVYCAAFSLLLLYRIVSQPRAFLATMHKPGESLFFGCVPMGVAVIAMGLVTFGQNVGLTGNQAHDGALVMFWCPPSVRHPRRDAFFWWIDVVLCAISMTVPPWLMITKHDNKIHSMPSLWLLPFVSTVVASALAGLCVEIKILRRVRRLLDSMAAGLIGPRMNTQFQEMYINIIGYILWGMGMFTAACVIAVYINRLILHGLPPPAAANSVWVVLGPVGQGANAIMLLGRHTGMLQCSGYLCRGHELLDLDQFDEATCLCPGSPALLDPIQSFGHVMPGVSLAIGLFLWGFGVWVYFLASSTSFHHSSLSSRLGLGGGTGIPFAPNWWGVVFPMVTLTMSTYQIHTDTEWRFFKIVGRVLAAILTLTACYIHALTIKHAVTPKFWHGFHPKQT